MAAVSGEACEKFLEENKKVEGVVELPSGLQYRVLKYGTGIAHPMVNCTCECHYAGALIDGTEFDSSYKRGAPTPFAPNQVIKGWTEALQLMVEGDKWELYIPYQLAYGESGRPPKIPGKAALVFQMEIIRIKDTKLTVPVTYPEWTEEDKKLLTEKDEEPIKKWREDRTKLWEEGQMRDKHPTREGFEEWLDRASQSSRNKALWKRTRTAKNKDFEDAIKPPRAPTKEEAREILDKAIAIFRQPENKEKLTGLSNQWEGQDPAQAGMTKMMTLMPVIQEMLGDMLKEYDPNYKPDDMLTKVMQIQALSSTDESIAKDVAMILKAVQGDFSELFP